MFKFGYLTPPLHNVCKYVNDAAWTHYGIMQKNAIAWEKKMQKIPLWGRSWSRNFHKITYILPFCFMSGSRRLRPPQAKKCSIFTILATLANKARDALLLGGFFSWIIWRIVMVPNVMSSALMLWVEKTVPSSAMT